MSTCAVSTRKDDYKLGLHVGALFIILGVSASACALPLVAVRVPRLRIPPKALFAFRHFGTGVLLATAFVHLFPTAFVSLTHPCLPPFFNETYPAFAGAIALASVFLITIAEMIFSPGRSLCSGPGVDAAATGDHPNTGPARNPSIAIDAATPAQRTPRFGRARSGRFHKKPVNSAREPNDTLEPGTVENKDEESVVDLALSGDGKIEEQRRKKLLMQCVLLECGILFHSVFIGMALAVAVGREQVVLLIAIAFHQCFEGLALGSRIAAVGWRSKALQPWLMALAYGCTTPLGQAIGIATRDLYEPDSETGLILVGSMNAISAGLLTYTSLVDLLSEDFLSDDSWRTLRGSRRVFAMSLVFFGAFGMSLIGAWA